MLSDREIDAAARELADLRRDDVLSRVLGRYGELLEDYRRLKSDYEEERKSRERYKKLAREQDRNPYVVVLVDGDGYIFQELGQKGGDDGGNAARALNEAVRLSLEAKGLDHCQIIVRVYADVAGVSKVLSKAGLCGPEKRSLGPFIASFNRCFGHSDFVDAGDLKENADFKLRALLRLHADNAQCKHIYFAACHDVGYISELTPHKGDSAKFTLVSTSGLSFHPHFTKLDMGIETLPGVFRSTPLDLAMKQQQHQQPHLRPSTITLVPEKAQAQTQADAASRAPSPGDESGGIDYYRICKFFPLGKCKYGTKCKNAHVGDNLGTATSWRRTSNGNTHGDGRLSPQVCDDDTEKSSTTPSSTGRHALHQKKVVQHKLEERTVDFDHLPKSIPSGFVATNRNGFRLDAFIPPVSRVVQSELRSRIKIRPVCNQWHLTGYCDNGDDCPYDHEPLKPSVKRALELLARSIRCRAAGKCRNELCTNGHICQNQQCRQYGGRDTCRLPYASHQQDLSVAQFLPADAPSQSQYDNMSSDNGMGHPDDDDDVEYEDSDQE